MENLSLYDQIEAQGALFNVHTEKLVTPNGAIVPGKVGIVNTQTNEVLGVVSKKYKVVTNAEVVESLMESLEASSLDLTDATADVKTSHGGARAMINVVLPAHEIALGNDVSKLQISTLNSYDGRWKYQSRAGAIRMACLNGQILGSFVGSYSSYHNQQLSTSKAAEQLMSMLDSFNEAKNWWAKMMKTKVNNEVVLQTISLMVDRKAEIDGEESDFMKRRTVEELFKLYDTYSKEMGKTAWALYNTLTDFATHTATDAANLRFKEDRVSEVLKLQPVFH